MILLACIGTYALADSAESLPDGIKHVLDNNSWNTYSIGHTNYGTSLMEYGEDACCYYDQYGNSAALVLMHNSSKNILCLFEKNGAGEWKLKYQSDGIVRQGESIPAITNETYGAFRISYLDDERCETLGITIEKQGNTWNVSNIFYKDPRGKSTSIDVEDKRLVYSEETNNWKKIVVQGIAPRSFEQFSLSTFPFTSSKGRETLSLPPDIPVAKDKYALPQAQNIKFTSNKKYAVYSGPGKNYFRAANGKASVSTNDWIQVFGYQGDWILIQYDISSDHMRIGWIQKSALPKKANVSLLNTNNIPVYTIQETAVTDDPLYSQQTIFTIPQGQKVSYLMSMGTWSYIAYSDGKTSLCGFVNQNCLQIGEDQLKQIGVAYLEQHTIYTEDQLNSGICDTSCNISAPSLKVTLQINGTETETWYVQFDNQFVAVSCNKVDHIP